MPHTVTIEGIKVNADTGKPLGRPPTNPKKRKIYEQLKAKAKAENPVPMATPKKSKGSNLLDGKDDLALLSKDEPTLSDTEVIKQISDRFTLMHKITSGACEGAVRSVVISGSGGVGKTYTVEQILEKYHDDEGIQFESVKGMVSPINLYMILFRNRTKNSVVLLDDADAIFADDDGLSLLKVALDSSMKRKVSWQSQSRALKAEEIPNSFYFDGSMIFITNLDFQAIVDHGKHKIVPHLQALMTRTLYLDLKLHTPREVGLWVDYMVTKNNILVQDGLTMDQQEDVLEYIADNRDKMRNLSIRSALKLSYLVKLDPVNWRNAARDLELR